MAFKRFGFALGILSASVFVLTVGDAVASKDVPRCLSYMTVGDSACDNPAPPEEEEKPEVVEKPVPPVVQAPVAPVVIPTKVEEPEETLEDQIDQFMDDYGKPPREFVEFNLNPTLENALKWAQKHREMMDRNKKIAAAWGQAQAILTDKETKGEELPDFNALPEIPDFGVPMAEGFKAFGEFTPSQMNVDPTPAGENITLGANSGLSLDGANGFSEGINLGASQVSDGRIGGVGSSGSLPLNTGPISISYYFSAQCPFCKKFEPGFNQLIKEMGRKLSVTCVDMTPGQKTLLNIKGKVDCAWRPLVPGEMRAKGVVSTPTLIIDRHIEGKSEEKIVGAVDIQKLRDFLMGGAK